MTTNHPAHGPVSLDRLHQISEILRKSAAQSDGGNLGYAMDDAVKVIDSAIAAFGAEPVAWIVHARTGDQLTTDGNYVANAEGILGLHSTPLYTTPPAPVVPEINRRAIADKVYGKCCRIPGATFYNAAEFALDEVEACRAAMLQAGNSPATPWIPVSERMPERDVDVQVYCADKKEQMVGYMERNEKEGWFRFASLPNGCGVYCQPTHWMPLPTAPQQEVK